MSYAGRFLVLIVISGILIGCGNTLTRDEADNIIKSWYPQNSDEYSITFVIGAGGLSVDTEQLIQLDELKKKGLIDYKLKAVRSIDPNLINIEIQITDKGKPYVEDNGSATGSRKIFFLREDFDQITNISQQGNYARVDYTTKFEPLEPFTEEEVDRLSPGCLEDNNKYTVSFIKYKDGWKQVPVP